MNKTALVIVVVVLGIVAGIVSGYAIWGNKVIPNPAPKPISEDNFVLDIYDHTTEEFQKWYQEMLDKIGEDWQLEKLQMPFNKFGMYYNYVFLREGESVEVVIRANASMSICEVEELSFDHPLLFHIDAGTGESLNETILSRHGVACDLKRADSGWELRFAFEAKKAGNYWLELTNSMPHQVYCQYAVMLKA